MLQRHAKDRTGSELTEDDPFPCVVVPLSDAIVDLVWVYDISPRH